MLSYGHRSVGRIEHKPVQLRATMLGKGNALALKRELRQTRIGVECLLVDRGSVVRGRKDLAQVGSGAGALVLMALILALNIIVRVLSRDRIHKN